MYVAICSVGINAMNPDLTLSALCLSNNESNGCLFYFSKIYKVKMETEKKSNISEVLCRGWTTHFQRENAFAPLIGRNNAQHIV